MKLCISGKNFSILNGTDTIASCTEDRPFIYAGSGKETVKMNAGNFKIKDEIEERVPLKVFEIKRDHNTLLANFSNRLLLTAEIGKDTAVLSFRKLDESINRLWIQLNAESDEKIYGCGEQFSYFNLRGRKFPLWSSEPGVGRDKASKISFQCERDSGSGSVK